MYFFFFFFFMGPSRLGQIGIFRPELGKNILFGIWVIESPVGGGEM